MPAPPARLAFFKLNVAQMGPALSFWRGAFGFEIAATFDEPEFFEHVLALPGQQAGPNLMLVEYKGEVWVISGDYKLTPDATCAAFEPVRCHF